MSRRSLKLLVGDNPFHGISHLSQERSRSRGNAASNPEYAAELVTISKDNGANGFMFSVSETTLSILRTLRKNRVTESLELYAIVPYAYDYVRLATQTGGISGLARKVAKQVVLSMNVRAMATGARAFMSMDIVDLLKTYLFYEISRIRSSAGRKARLSSVLLHEIVTEMVLAFNLEQLLKLYIDFMLRLGIKPGFETRNFTYLVDRFNEWNINFADVTIATPFNKVGFQMNPSREKCEEALARVSAPSVVAMSILAAGFIRPVDAIGYIESLSNLEGVVVGVSRELHARESFRILSERLS